MVLFCGRGAHKMLIVPRGGLHNPLTVSGLPGPPQHEGRMLKKWIAIVVFELCMLYSGSTWSMTNTRLHSAIVHDADHVS